MEVIGPNAGITGASDGAVLAGRIERYYRSALVMTFGGGTNEIQRDIIGYVGLGPAGSEEVEQMDFTFTPEQDEAAELAAKILKDRATNERMKAVEADGSRFDRDLWAELGSRRAARARAPRGVRRRRARPGRAVPGPGRGRADRRAGAAGGARPRGPAPGRARQRRPEAAVAARRGDRRERPDRGGRRGARRSHPSGRPRPRRRPATATADRQQGDRAGGSLRRRVPGAGRDAVRGGRLPGRCPATRA